MNPFGIDDRWLSWGLGLTCLHAAIQGSLRGYAETVPGLTIVVLHVVVGCLFMVRRRGHIAVGWRDTLVCFSSLIVSGSALKLAPPFGQWPVESVVAFGLGGVAAMLGFITLGTSFGVFPAVRGVVSSGPFRLLRHPIYAAELTMLAAATWAAATWLAAGLLIATLTLLMWRVEIEERALQSVPSYQAYRSEVRWRLFPGLW